MGKRVADMTPKEIAQRDATAKAYRESDKGRQYQKEYMKTYWDDMTPEKWSRKRLGEIKQRAKCNGLDFDLTLKDLEYCEYCPIFGIKLDISPEASNDNKPSVDRIDNSKGYVRGNVHIVSGRANRIKSDASLEELRLLTSYLEQLDRDQK